MTRRKMELGANVKAIKGTSAALAISGGNAGYVVPMIGAVGLMPLGRFGETVDNTSGALGAKKVEVLFHRQFEVLHWANDSGGGTPVTKAMRGSLCYAKDNDTVSGDATSRSAAGLVWDVVGSEVLVEPAQALQALLEPHTAFQVAKKTVTIAYNHASFLAEGDDGDAVDVNVGTALPAGAMLLGARYTIGQVFAGAGLATLTMKVGFSGDTDGVIEAVDVLGDATAEYRGVPGTAMGGPAGGKQLVANFDPDNAAGIDELTAGSVTIDVFYAVL